MSYRGQCPTCGKVLVIGKGEIGKTAVCGACGTRFAVRVHEQTPVESLHASPEDLRPAGPAATATPTPGLLAAMGDPPEDGGDADGQDVSPALRPDTSDPELAAAVA